MSEDAAAKQARELLPCECDGFLFVDGISQESHTVMCPAYYRPALAAALEQAAERQRAKDAEIARGIVCKPENKTWPDHIAAVIAQDVKP